jgi:hypothetical protein
MPPPPGSNTDRPDANYRPARQDSINPGDVPDGYYNLSEPPLRTLVLQGLRRIGAAIPRPLNLTPWPGPVLANAPERSG